MGLPSLTRPFLLRHKWLIELLSFLVAIGAIGSTYFVHQELAEASLRMERSDGGTLSFTPVWWSYAISALGALVSMFKAGVAFHETSASNHKESPKDLQGCCIVLHAMLGGQEVGSGLRITIHAVTEWRKKSPVTMIQIVPYACQKKTPNGEIGRTTSASCGIIGLAARTGKPQSNTRQATTSEEFVEEMQKWGYSREQALELDDSRWAWMACPLFDKHGKAIGVVFLDSARPGYFSPEKQNEVLRGVEGLNAFVEERYP